MSSTFVADTSDDHKTDNTLIIIVNNDGTISVDQETLQNILANQQNTAVSVVRVGGPSQGDDSSQDSSGTCDSQNDGNPHVNLTVEGFYPPPVTSDPGEVAAVSAATPPTPAAPVAAPASNVEMVSDMVPPSAPAGTISAVTAVPPASSAEGESLDPFLEMDPEQLERLETALQSEQAKQILGENVTAMLDMLSVDEEATQLKDSILMDHCYTNRSPSTAPAAPPAVTPVITHSYPPNNGREDGSILLQQADHVQQIIPTGMGPPVVQTIVRGRGRGRPGRPRRDGSSTRGATSATVRGMTRGGLGRGGIKIQRGGTFVSGTGAGNMIMVQQIKQITPPLSAAGGTTPTGATMVPVVRPLVLAAPSATGQVPGGTIVRTSAPGQVQKQIIAVPQGARLVAVQGKPGSCETGAPQTVLLTNAAGQVVQTQQIQGVSSVPTQLSNATNAKVVVAKMPPILPPHQFLGAQPTTLPLTEQPSQQLQKEDESDFTDFPQEASEDSESEESDVGSDDEYRDPTVGRRGGRGIKGRGRFGRGARSRGGYRVYEGGRGGGRGNRRGRGRGFARAEELDRVKKLDAEMAGFVAAMEKSPERALSLAEKSAQEVREKHVKKEELNTSSVSSLETSKKKMLKVYGKSVKKIPDLGLEDVHVKLESISAEKAEKHPPLTTPEKKSPVLKSPVKRHSPEIPTSATPVSSTPVTPTTPTTPNALPVLAGGDSRKNYPKRENRKPPAHLAEALGPALFSTPDIIRRVSTGAEQKPIHEQTAEEKKEAKSASGAGSLEMAVEEKITVVVPEATEKDPQSVPTGIMQDVVDQVVMDALQTTTLKTEDLLSQSLLVSEDPVEEKAIDNSSLVLKAEPDPEVIASQEIKPKQQAQQSQKPPMTLKSQMVLAVKRSSRRRSSSSSATQQNENLIKKEGGKHGNAPGKDKKRPEEKQKGRRQSGDEDDDEDLPSSDDESWNSEDDPDRLWCICKKPHNNRFMICCDVCEDWFHGKCVGVTKAMGKQMENKGLEWSCPNCAKKKEDDKEAKRNVLPSQKEKDIKKIRDSKKDIPERTNEAVHTEIKETSVIGSGEGISQGSSSDAEIMYCIVCKKEARPSSIYCGDACILKHAQESLNCISRDKAVTPGSTGGGGGRDAIQETQPSQHQGTREAEGGQSSSGSAGANQPPRTRPDARVIVFERKSGILLAGPNAPTAGNLKTWLKDNPTFEVVRPGLTPTNKFYSSKTQGTKTIVQSSKVPHQKTVVQHIKVGQTHPSNVSPIVQAKIGPTQKLGATPQKTILLQQKLTANTLKSSINQPKIVTPVSSPIKVLPTKVHKGPIVVPAQPQKVVIKASPKQSTTSAKIVVKTPGATTVSKVPSSPSSKTPPTNIVSKAPATSTVKESAKTQVEKPVAKKVEVKRQSSSSSSDTGKKEEEKEKPSGPEPIRLNVRKTLQELLQARIQECSDLDVPETEVQNLAVNIEEEMHSFFRDTGIKYKSKYRSLVFNIKDRKNLTLFRKIADKSLTPHQLVRLSPEELASQELAQWREREAKHQLEMIKKTELDLMSQAKTYVMKTHKGEQVIETDESLKVEVPELVDPSTVPDLVSPVNNSVSSTVEDTDLDKSKGKTKDKDSKDKKDKEDKERSRDREKSRHDDKRKDKSEKSRSDRDRRDSHHDRHDRDKRKDSKEREKSKSSSRDKHRNSEKSKRDSDRHRDGKSSSSSSRKDKKEDIDIKKEDIKKEILLPEFGDEYKDSDNLFIKDEPKNEMDISMKSLSNFSSTKVEPQEDSDLSDREPSSTVTIKTPDINTEEHEKNVCTTVWKGFVNMPEVAKFFTTVQIVSGDPQNLCKDLPDTVDIVGRIAPKTVWDYISKMKKTGTKEILVIRLTAANDEEKIPYITLYTYLSTRGRLGVVGNVSKMIKDFYIMPLASHHPVPQILLPLEGPGFEEYRPHLLIGILVRARRKRLAPENEYVAKMPKRILPPPTSAEPLERSYTPPLPGSDADMLGSLTPPHPPPSHTGGSYTPPSSPQGFLGGTSLLTKTPDPRSRMDKDSLQDDFSVSDKPITSNKASLSTLVGQYGDDDEDEDDDDAPYSPGGSDDDVESSEDSMIVTSKNPVELQRKVEELNRKIEEQKQQIESISSAIVASDPSVAALGTVSESLKVNSMMQTYMLGSEESAAPEDGDENEAYSPSRSFTPPSTSIPFLGPAEAGSAPVFTKLTSNINLPSNLHEILATIKKQESDKAAGTKSINLKSDPIVQNYGKTADVESVQSKVSTDDFSDADPSEFASVAGSGLSTPTTASPSIIQSASSALLSLSTPVVHPLASGGSVMSTSVTAKVVDSKVSRDPRQRGSEGIGKASGSTLSTLSDDDLIKKALEMEMEMTEPKINTGITDQNIAVTIPTLQQPLPPGVDSLPAVSGTVPPVKTSVSKSLPPGQPLPPGVEDEDYPSYSSFGVTSPSTVIPPMNIPVAPYNMRSPNISASYRVSHPYPGASYVSPARIPPQAPGYSSSFPPPPGGYPANAEDSCGPPSNTKRKFSDGESDENVIKRDRSDSPSNREAWDSKMPVPVRGRFSGRGRGFVRGAPPGQRGFVRLRGGSSHPPGPPPPPPPPPPPLPNRSRWDNKDNERKRSRYESARPDWEAHNKDFDEKHRERSREGHHRDRSRERDKSTGNQRSHSTRSNRSRESEKGSDSP
ncbi:CXXC-type zinc finger protein 1 [Gryllus bimaculatus]|nr:CXXC-type zinc finger protein 1 [Gryllus bimaculatus]